MIQGVAAKWSFSCLSATNAENQQIAKQTPSFIPKNVKSGVFVLFKIIQPLHNKRVAILKESDEKRLIFIYPFTLIFQDFTSS
jgi:predicted homoserine dehydrogenase-like protein